MKKKFLKLLGLSMLIISISWVGPVLSESAPRSERKHSSDTSQLITLELIGEKKKSYSGEIYDQNGEKVTDFYTDSSGEYTLKRAWLRENQTKVFVYLTTQENLIPKKGIGTDFKSGLISFDKKDGKFDSLKIKIVTKFSTLSSEFKVTFIDKLLGKTSENFKVALYDETGSKKDVKKANKDGKIVFDKVMQGNYRLEFLSIKQGNFISLTNNNQHFFNYSDKVTLNALNGPAWERGAMYIISVPAFIIMCIVLLLVSIPLMYISLGFALPRKEER